MIQFTDLSDESLGAFLDTLPKRVRKDAEETLRPFLEEEGDTSAAVSFTNGCLLIRYFDTGRYYFFYPTALEKSADVPGALGGCYEYAAREELPVEFLDVDLSELPTLLSGVLHAEVDAMGGGAYAVRVKTPLDYLEEIPTVEGEGVVLSAILPEDVKAYARLCSDVETNRFWGYDYHEDLPGGGEPGDEWFFEEAEKAFSFRTGLYFAIRDPEGRFVGEVELYGFDGRGFAEIGIRLLPEERRKGFGRAAFCAAAEFCEGLGLSSLRTSIFVENTPSVYAFSELFDEKTERDGRYYFVKYLN